MDTCFDSSGPSAGKARVTEGRMKIVGAIYAIESGRVRFLS
jgi:hypothetical protein